MGIDKSNIRLVYHFGAPAALESYYQQVCMRHAHKIAALLMHCSTAAVSGEVVFGYAAVRVRVRKAPATAVSSMTWTCIRCRQVGRAGRDGLQSRCILLWSPGDWVKNDMIKVIKGMPLSRFFRRVKLCCSVWHGGTDFLVCLPGISAPISGTCSHIEPGQAH